MAKRWSEVKKGKKARAHGPNRRRKSYGQRLAERTQETLKRLAAIAQAGGYSEDQHG
jgi:hypothetical protein